MIMVKFQSLYIDYYAKVKLIPHTGTQPFQLSFIPQ